MLCRLQMQANTALVIPYSKTKIYENKKTLEPFASFRDTFL